MRVCCNGFEPSACGPHLLLLSTLVSPPHHWMCYSNIGLPPTCQSVLHKIRKDGLIPMLSSSQQEVTLLLQGRPAEGRGTAPHAFHATDGTPNTGKGPGRKPLWGTHSRQWTSSNQVEASQPGSPDKGRSQGTAHQLQIIRSDLHFHISSMYYHLFFSLEFCLGSYLIDVQKSKFNLL